MKLTVLMATALLCCGSLFSQDLPGPAANIQTLPAGSYVIAMDNTNQSNVSGFFNLKSYGLIAHLLNQFIKVKRVIKTGKVKDGIDFSVNAAQIKPVAGSAAIKDFKAGPFVVFAPDTTGVAALVQGFNNAQTNDNYVKLYITNANVSVDIRHNLSGFIPKAAILNDGGNQAVHVNYMNLAGMNTTNYAINSGANLLSLCFTFASEPHNSLTGAAVDTTISRIKNFVTGGGNFLAQCEAVINYENNLLGRFQSTNGITAINTSLSGTDAFPNPDLAYNQFEGSYAGKQGGSLQTWMLSPGSSIANSMYHTCDGSTKNDTMGASVSKLNSGTGGLVFYIGNHSFSNTSNYDDINGVRMYMNAFLTPVAIHNNCSISQPLSVQLNSFDATRRGMNVELVWETATEMNCRGFYIERSIGGSEFKSIRFVASSALNGNSVAQLYYKYTDVNAAKEMTSYRVRQIDLDGKSKYTSVRTVAGYNQNKEAFVFPNPVFDGSITILTNDSCTISIMDMNGRTLKQIIRTVSSGIVNVDDLAPGTYIVKIIISGTHKQIIQRIVIRNQ